jgi:hypothetical protein
VIVMLSTVALARDNVLSLFPGELRHSPVALPTIPVHRMADASSSADVGRPTGTRIRHQVGIDRPRVSSLSVSWM